MNPGTLVCVKNGTIVRRFNSEEEHYTQRDQWGLVLCLTHVWREIGVDGDASPTYLVMFSHDSRLYYVPAWGMQTPDQLSDPGRLFGRLSG